MKLRWLDWLFWGGGGVGGYLPSLSINYVDMSKDMGKRLPQLYYIRMRICYDLGFIAVGVAMATLRRHDVFYLSLCFSVPGFIFNKSLEGVCTCHNCLNLAKFEQIL